MEPGQSVEPVFENTVYLVYRHSYKKKTVKALRQIIKNELWIKSVSKVSKCTRNVMRKFLGLMSLKPKHITAPNFVKITTMRMITLLYLIKSHGVCSRFEILQRKFSLVFSCDIAIHFAKIAGKNRIFGHWKSSLCGNVKSKKGAVLHRRLWGKSKS